MQLARVPVCDSAGCAALRDGRGDSRYAFQVSQAPSLHQLARRVRENEREIEAAWRAAFERSRLRAPRAGVTDAVAPLLSSMLDGLALALGSDAVAAADTTGADTAGADALAADALAADALVPGAPALRELEKNTGFAGATMAAAGLSGYDVAAFLLALREALRQRVAADHGALLQRLFEWLSALALDAFATARVMTANERMRAELERGTPVVLVAPRVPGVLLVGAPDRHTLDVIFDRAVVLVVTQSAPAIIVDATGLADPLAPGVLDGMRRFAGHEHIAGRAEILAVGLADDHAAAWARLMREAGATMRREERFRDAVETALARTGSMLVPRS